MASPVGLPEGFVLDEPKSSGGLPEGFLVDDIAPESATMTEPEFTARYGDIPDIYGQIAPQEPAPERPIGDQLVGAGEAALTALTGAAGGTLGVIGGTLQGLAEEIRSGEFGSQEAASRIEQRAADLMQTLTYAPRTEAGQEYVKAIGEVGAAAAPLAGLAGPVQQIGQLGKAARPQVAQATRQAAQAAKPVADIAKGVFEYQSPAKRQIARLIEQGSADVETAPYKLTSKETPRPKSKILRAIDAGAPKIEKDPISISAIDQGFDRGVIASVKGASPTDRSAMREMLNVFEKGRKNALYAARNRPTDIIGDRIVSRFDEVKKANKKAGRDINKAAIDLKGRRVDATPIGDKFANDLSDSGVTITPDRKLNFEGSDFEDLPAVERTLSTVFRRMSGPTTPDAYELHRMKRFIDEQVSYGKGGEGLTGSAESMLKSLRRSIDDTLDDNFENYKVANDIYSETITAIDDLQGAAGKIIDLSGENANKVLGTAMRSALSNNKGRIRITEAVQNIEDVARKYPDELLLEGPESAVKGRKPDLLQLLVFADELDSRFGPVARTSLQGQFEQVAKRGVAQAASPTQAAADVVVGAAARGLEKVKGVSDDKAFKAMRDLLSE